jgi:hypothetical protein
MAAAESAADMTFSLILHPARATRLVQHHSLDNSLPSLEMVIDKLIQATFKSGIKKGYEAQLQMTVDHVLLNNLIKLALNESASAQARAVAFLKIDQLGSWLTGQSKAAIDESWKAHYVFELHAVNSFRDDPKEYKSEPLLTMPPGQPIGQDDEFCDWRTEN